MGTNSGNDASLISPIIPASHSLVFACYSGTATSLYGASTAPAQPRPKSIFMHELEIKKDIGTIHSCCIGEDNFLVESEVSCKCLRKLVFVLRLKVT